MVFEPVESRSDALEEARLHFLHRGRSQRSLKSKFFERFHILRRRLSLVYYPLWIGRYQYRNRGYQVVVDGVKGNVLYGKAPGNIFFRAAMLVGGMAAGTFLLVNGTAIAGFAMANSDDGEGFFLILLPIVFGIALIAAGYRAFRYGEEVESIQQAAKKATLAGRGGSKDLFSTGLNLLEEMSEFNKLS